MKVSYTRFDNNSDKWNTIDEILDAVHDIPIEDHLGYKVEFPEGIYRETLSGSGITTVEHAGLDRKPLRTARLVIWQKMQEKITEINSFKDGPRKYTAKKILNDKCEGIHGSLIKWILNKNGI
jgi:hypothetical protein